MSGLLCLLMAFGGLTDWAETSRFRLPISFQSAHGLGAQNQMILTPEIDWTLWGAWSLEASLRVRGDSTDQVYEDRAEVNLENFVLNADWNRFSLRLGKQEVAWGQLDGIQVLDVLNPRRFDLFILQDTEDARIPVWMVNASFTSRVGEAQVIWVPKGDAHTFAGATTDFAFNTGGGMLPEGDPEGGDFGFRLSRFKWG